MNNSDLRQRINLALKDIGNFNLYSFCNHFGLSYYKTNYRIGLNQADSDEVKALWDAIENYKKHLLNKLNNE